MGGLNSPKSSLPQPAIWTPSEAEDSGHPERPITQLSSQVGLGSRMKAARVPTPRHQSSYTVPRRGCVRSAANSSLWPLRVVRVALFDDRAALGLIVCASRRSCPRRLSWKASPCTSRGRRLSRRWASWRGGCAADLHLHRAGGPRPAGGVGRSACRAELRPHAEDRESPLTLMSGYATGEMHSFLGRHGLLLEQDACEDACLAYLRQHGRTGRGPGGDVIAAVSGTSKVGGA